MFELSHFFNYCQQNNIHVIYFDDMPAAGVTMRIGKKCGVFLDLKEIHSVRILKGICYHELGHAATGALHKVDSQYETVERSEYRANRWAAQNFLTVQDFEKAFTAGYTEIWELADYFDLPEQDIKNALSYWTERKGVDFIKSKCTIDI